MPRNTESERRAVDRMTERMTEQARRNGISVPRTDEIRRKAQQIAEHEDAARRDGRRKDGTG